MEIKLSIDDKYVDAFITLIKKLKYVEIKEISDTTSNTVEEPVTAYNQKEKLSADDVEKLIIAKALRNAKAIECGELETRPLDELLAELENS